MFVTVIFACLQLIRTLYEIGGVLGLWIGLSVMTMAEFVEILFHLFKGALMALNAKKRRQAAKRQQQPSLVLKQVPKSVVNAYSLFVNDSGCRTSKAGATAEPCSSLKLKYKCMLLFYSTVF